MTTTSKKKQTKKTNSKQVDLSKRKVNKLLRAQRRAKAKVEQIDLQLLTGDRVLGDSEKVKLRAVRDALQEVFA